MSEDTPKIHFGFTKAEWAVGLAAAFVTIVVCIRMWTRAPAELIPVDPTYPGQARPEPLPELP